MSKNVHIRCVAAIPEKIHRADDGRRRTRVVTDDCSACEDNRRDVAGAEVEGAVHTEDGTFTAVGVECNDRLSALAQYGLPDK